MRTNQYRTLGLLAIAALCVPGATASHPCTGCTGDSCAAAPCEHTFKPGFSPAALELLKEQRLWFNTSNAAGAILDDTRNYSLLRLGYDRASGSYHRPQQGEKVSNFGVDCEGFMNLNTALVWGAFSFKQSNITKAQYNASIVDPFRGMPYFYADEHLSDWHNQYYDMKFRASTPLYWNRLALGVEGVYRASLAAKQLDPRVDSRYFELGINPGLVFAINKHNSVGADFQYSAIKEDSRMSNVNTTVPQTYYLLFGLGMSGKQIGDGFRSDYHGHLIGGGLQYNYRNANLDVLLSGDYTRHVENVDRNPTVPEKIASVKDDVWKASLQLRVHGARWINQFTFGAARRDIDGIQYTSEYDNNETDPAWIVTSHLVRSTYKTNTLGGAYSIIRKRAGEYAWRVDAGIDYIREKDRYILPEAHKNYENLYTHITGKYNFAIGKGYNRRLLLAATYGYLANLSGSCAFSDLMPDNPTLTDLEPRDLEYLTANAWNLRGEVTYSQKVKENNSMNCYLKAEFNYTKATTHDFSNRHHMAFTLGFTF